MFSLKTKIIFLQKQEFMKSMQIIISTYRLPCTTNHLVQQEFKLIKFKF